MTVPVNMIFWCHVQIGPKEMAGAVREMLSAAGMPVDLERTNLLERTLRLQDELERATSRLSTIEQVVQRY